MKKTLLAVCIFAFLALPVLVRVFTVNSMSTNIYIALFGVLITALITYMLLDGQKNQQVEIKTTSASYKEKMRLYKLFLEKLEDIVAEGTSTREQLLQLHFLVSKLSIHMKIDQVCKISGLLKEIVDELGAGRNEQCLTSDATIKPKDTDTVCYQLMEIAEIFNADLYKTESNRESEKLIIDITKNLCDLRSIERMEGEGGIEGMEGESGMPSALEEIKEAYFQIFEAKRIVEQCKVQRYENQPGLVVECKTDLLGIGTLYFCINNEGGREGWFFHCHLDFQDDRYRRECYLAMRRKFGGYFNKWCWWMPVKEQERMAEKGDKEFQEYLLGTVRRVYDWVLKYKEMAVLANKYSDEVEKECPGWRHSFWENYIWNFFNDSSAMYVDIKISENDPSLLEVWLCNRRHNIPQFNEQLARLGVPDQEAQDLGRWDGDFWRVAALPESKVVECLKQWLPKMSEIKPE